MAQDKGEEGYSKRYSVPDTRYRTNRYPGFFGGAVDSSGNLVTDKTGMSQVFADREALAREREAQAEQKRIQREIERQQETPYGPADGEHRSIASRSMVPNKWEQKDYRRFMNPMEDTYETILKPYAGANASRGVAEALRNPAKFQTMNPARSAVTMGEQLFGRVICTELRRQRMMSAELHRADLRFTEHLSPCTARGYRYWAVPYVRLMRRSRLATRLIRPIALWRAKEIAYRMGLRDRPCYPGKLVRWLLEPACFLIGLFCPERDWSTLYGGHHDAT